MIAFVGVARRPGREFILTDFFITAIQGLRVMAKAGPDPRRLAGVVKTALAVLP